MKVLTKVTLALLLFILAGPAQAQQTLDDTIYGYYRQYLKRSPQRSELRHWARRVEDAELTIDEVQAAILSSPEYFRLHRNRPRWFIRSLYTNLLGRRSSEDEVDGWMQHYDANGGNRKQIVRTFQNSARRELQLREQEATYRRRPDRD